MSVQPEVKSRIVRLHAAGRGRNQIARELSIRTRQVDRVCREAGLEFDTARTMKAAQARRSAAAQDRSELAADARALAARVLEDAAEVEDPLELRRLVLVVADLVGIDQRLESMQARVTEDEDPEGHMDLLEDLGGAFMGMGLLGGR